MMRIAALAGLLACSCSIGTARAQTYDPDYPVCLEVYGPLAHYECRFFSIPQCQQSASGRAAQCMINPYFKGAADHPVRRYRRRHH